MSLSITQTQGNINAIPWTPVWEILLRAAQSLHSMVHQLLKILLQGSSYRLQRYSRSKTIADQLLVIEAAGNHTIAFNAADNCCRRR
jgi:hypothetical protein